jgi:membrane protein DedA with SNARE-associated domain
MRIIATIIFLLHSFALFAQRPTHVPGQSGPVNFFESPANIVLYIVLPIVIVFFYILWRRWVRKNQKEKEGKD